jgi:hypothetical protein
MTCCRKPAAKILLLLVRRWQNHLAAIPCQLKSLRAPLFFPIWPRVRADVRVHHARPEVRHLHRGMPAKAYLHRSRCAVGSSRAVDLFITALSRV